MDLAAPAEAYVGRERTSRTFSNVDISPKEGPVSVGAAKEANALLGIGFLALCRINLASSLLRLTTHRLLARAEELLSRPDCRSVRSRPSAILPPLLHPRQHRSEERRV